MNIWRPSGRLGGRILVGTTLAVAVLALGSTALAASDPAQEDPAAPTCQGEAATIVVPEGTTDDVHGTPAARRHPRLERT